MNEEEHHDVHQIILDELREVRSDVKSLLAFKYQLLGVTITLSTIIPMIIAVIALP